MNIICFGDSITSAKDFAEGDRWPTILQMKLNLWQPERYKVYNRGMGGHTTAQGLERMAEDVLPLLPGLLLVQFGFNDSNIRPWSRIARVSVTDYQMNLREFYRIAQTRESRCVFIINHAIRRDDPAQHQMPNGNTYQANFQPYQQALREATASLNAPIIDLPRLMQERTLDVRRFVADDGLHLSVAGNHLYGAMVYDALRQANFYQ